VGDPTTLRSGGSPSGFPSLRYGGEGNMEPLFSVVVCTRNRMGNVVPTAVSILATRSANLELIILDQSDDDATRLALDAFLEAAGGDTRLRYFRLSVPGKPNALNKARAVARGRYIVLTDDDCECAPDWLQNIQRAFEEHPEVACVFGEVEAAPHDPAIYYVLTNHIPAPHAIFTLREWIKMPDNRNAGIGANMAVRANALREVGGWDPCVGPGAKFGSGDDHDLTVRLLLRGYGVYFCPDARVVHYGFRALDRGSTDMERVGGGFGAAFAKYLRCGVLYHGSLRMFLFFLARALWRLFRPHKGLAFVRGWVRGFLGGLRHRVDRHSRCFESLEGAEAQRYGDNFGRVVLRGR